MDRQGHDQGQSRWEARYSGDDYWYGTEPSGFLRRHSDWLPSRGKALALADGEGRNGVFLAERGLDVTSLDYAETALAKGRRLAEARGVPLLTVAADLFSWAWPEAGFDVVAALFIQFLTPEQRADVFARIRRSLKPGGLLVLQGFSTAQIELNSGGPGILSHLYGRELLAETFGDFDDVHIEEERAELSEGPGHSGPAALIGFIGRRPAG